jgi:hypothetical protein
MKIKRTVEADLAFLSGDSDASRVARCLIKNFESPTWNGYQYVPPGTLTDSGEFIHNQGVGE